MNTDFFGFFSFTVNREIWNFVYANIISYRVCKMDSRKLAESIIGKMGEHQSHISVRETYACIHAFNS